MRTRIIDVTDEPAERDTLPAPPVDAGNPTDPAGVNPDLADRRAFIRQLSGDAVSSAGRIAGLHSVIRRSVLAAGLAATREFEPPPATDLPDADLPGTDPPVASATPPSDPVQASPTPSRAVDVVAALTPAQHEFLAHGASAVLAVNDLAGAPHLSASIYQWDGAILRLPSQMFAARAGHVDRDPRVSVFIDDRQSGAWVAVTGVASIVYGSAVEDELRLVLAGYRAGDSAADRWAQPSARGDAIVIQIRPTRFLWRPA